MTDITHYTIYHKSKRWAGFIPPASCLLRITTLWSQTAIPPPPLLPFTLDLERGQNEQKPTHEKQTVHFLSVGETKLEFVNIMFVVWFEWLAGSFLCWQQVQVLDEPNMIFSAHVSILLFLSPDLKGKNSNWLRAHEYIC